MLSIKTVGNVSWHASLAVMVVLLWCFPSPAKEVKYPTPSYEGEELAKVKEWEKTWVGKKVSTAEVDQVKDLLPESVYTIMKNPKDFGAEGDIWFEVVPYREYKVSPGLIESTPAASSNAGLFLVSSSGLLIVVGVVRDTFMNNEAELKLHGYQEKLLIS